MRCLIIRPSDWPDSPAHSVLASENEDRHSTLLVVPTSPLPPDNNSDTFQLFLSVKSKLIMRNKILQLFVFLLASISAGYDVAFEVLGGAGADDLLSPDQKKLLEAAYKRKRDDENSAAWAGAKRPASQYLSMALAGGKKLKRDRTNSPCHLCQ